MVYGNYGSWEVGHIIVYSYKGNDHTCVTLRQLSESLVLNSLSSAKSSAHTALESINKYNAGGISGYSRGNGNLNI